MEKSHAADWASDAPTPAQLKEFFAQIESGRINGDRLQNFLRNPHRFVENRVTLTRALAIFGYHRVLAGESAKVWNQPVPENVPIRYSEVTLRECAEQNRTACTDWRLVFVFGFSLREQWQMKGTDSNHQPCFYNNDWWLEKKEDDWATQKPESGYHLIDFNGRWGRTSWNNQEAEIKKLGSSYERSQEAVIAEAILSIYQTTGERLLENWYHWGRNLDSCGYRVGVGNFDRGGLDASIAHPDWDDVDDLRVCLSRKFQF